MTRRKRVIMLSVLALSGAAVGAATAARQPERPSGPGLPHFDRAPDTVSAVPSRVADAFPAFQRKAVTSDAPGAIAQRALDDGPVSEFGANPDLARSAGSGGRFWLVPADDVLCLADDEGLVACNGTDAALEGQLAMVLSVDGSQTVSGALPEGAEDPIVSTRDGEQASAELEDGIYSVTVDAAVTGVSFGYKGERHTIPLTSG